MMTARFRRPAWLPRAVVSVHSLFFVFVLFPLCALSVTSSLLAAGELAPGQNTAGEQPAPADAALAEADPDVSPMAESDAEYRAAIEAWRRERDDRLRHPDGWLTLAGLHWLGDGVHLVGSAADALVRLPDSVPERVGRLLAEPAPDDSTAYRLEVADGVELMIAGEPSRGAVLRSDAQGAPTRVEIGPVVFYLIERSGRVGVRVKDEESEVLRSFHGIAQYAIDRDWRVEARYVPYETPREIPVPSALGYSTQELAPGYVAFERDGAEHRLDVLEGGDENEVFVLFADTTNGRATYGGGRFLYALLDGDLATPGSVVLDFNKSYNPPCAFTPYATCPLPPSQNRLQLAIEAGERAFGEEH
ncbi:MAG: DUF1684 domain-containing protein [Acidobacteriota bacterium]